MIDYINKLTEKIIGLSIQIHKALGPGFAEKIYTEALTYELELNGIKHENEKIIKVRYKEKLLGQQRIDFLIEGKVVLEIKASGEIGNIDLAQILSYLKTTNKKIGLILNFGSPTLEIKRVIN